MVHIIIARGVPIDRGSYHTQGLWGYHSLGGASVAGNGVIQDGRPQYDAIQDGRPDMMPYKMAEPDMTSYYLNFPRFHLRRWGDNPCLYTTYMYSCYSQQETCSVNSPSRYRNLRVQFAAVWGSFKNRPMSISPSITALGCNLHPSCHIRQQVSVSQDNDKFAVFEVQQIGSMDSITSMYRKIGLSFWLLRLMSRVYLSVGLCGHSVVIIQLLLAWRHTTCTPFEF